MGGKDLQLLFCTFSLIWIVIKCAYEITFQILKTLVWRIPKAIYKWHKKRKLANKVASEASQLIDRNSNQSQQRESDPKTFESLTRTNSQASISSRTQSDRASLNSLSVAAESSSNLQMEAKERKMRTTHRSCDYQTVL